MEAEIYRLLLEQQATLNTLEQKVDRMNGVIMSMAGKMGMNPNAQIDEVMAAFDMTPAKAPEGSEPFDMTPAKAPENSEPFDMTPGAGTQVR